MRQFMLARQTLVPPGYAERACVLVKYRLPWLRHCYVLCHAPAAGAPPVAQEQLLGFFLAQAHQLAQAAVGDAHAFMLIHSGASVRKRANLHLHVFVIRHRWQKSWVYTVLGAKNLMLACTGAVARLLVFTRRTRSRGATSGQAQP